MFYKDWTKVRSVSGLRDCYISGQMDADGVAIGIACIVLHLTFCGEIDEQQFSNCLAQMEQLGDGSHPWTQLRNARAKETESPCV